MKNKEKKGILILGASGGVSQAFLQLLVKYRNKFSDVILLDKNDSVVRSKFINHKKLKYVFIQKSFVGQIDDILAELTKKYKIDILLDLSDQATLPTLKAANDFDISYLNCSVNSDDSSLKRYSENFNWFITTFKNRTHVLSLGMNPGIINHLLIKGILEHGLPNDYVEIEYETGVTKDKPKKPFITWSKTQFLAETVWDPSGYSDINGKYFEFKDPAIKHLVDTTPFLKPLKDLEKYPLAMIVPHDEIVSMSRILEIPGRFLYAIHPDSLEMMQDLLEKQKTIKEEEVLFLDNVENKLQGSDIIGIWLNYDDKKVCYYCEVFHEDIQGTNATLYLVAVGVLSGLLDFLKNGFLETGVLHVHQLHNKNFLKTFLKFVKLKKVIID